MMQTIGCLLLRSKWWLNGMRWRVYYALWGRPARASEILGLGSYHSYLRYQRKYAGFESDISKYSEGQRRYIDLNLSPLDKNLHILDCACGDGVGLQHLAAIGFVNLTGVDVNTDKIARARRSGARIFCSDMHSMPMLNDSEFDVVYSSHTLEHAYEPHRVVSEFRRVLKPGGRLYVVLPYPDTRLEDTIQHCGKFELGLDINDDGQTVTRYFEQRGFRLLDKQFDSFREPEIWLVFEKV